jgi:hypothetical protein
MRACPDLGGRVQGEVLKVIGLKEIFVIYQKK